MKGLCLAVTVSLALSLIPMRLPAQPLPQEDSGLWMEKLRRQDDRLRRQEWEAVAKDSRKLVDDMVDGLLVGEASSAMLALGVLHQALVEFSLGHRDEAVWLLHLAQNLDARYRDVALGSYGPAGEELGRFRLRQLGEAPAAWPKLPAEGSFQPPRVLRQKEPRTPGALARARLAAEIEVEMVVGPDGRVAEPVLLTEPKFPSLAFVILESLRDWRFEPARASGSAVPALFRIRISHEKLRKAAESSTPSQRAAASSRLIRRRLENIDARLRRGEGAAVHAAIQELVDELRVSGPENGLLAAALRALALAEAAVGRRDEAVGHWQTAQNLQAGLVMDPGAYGEAGTFLARHSLRRPGAAPAGLEAIAAAGLGAGSTPPRKIAGGEPEVPAFLASPRDPRWARLQVVIDTEGRVVEPVVLAGRSEAFRWAALEAVRTWRFEPARREGQPVAVFLDIELPPRAEKPLAEMMPLTREAAGVHALLLKQDWGTARAKAMTLVQSVAEERGDDPRPAATALALLALAEAGSENPSAPCYWHAAQSLYGDLYHASLAAYEFAGALLEQSSPWRLNEEIRRAGLSPWDNPVLRPEKIGGPAPEYPARDRRNLIQGAIVTDIVVEEDGRVTQPRLLQGLTPGLDLKNLVTLCQWRFKPATLDGKPVKVYNEITTTYSVMRGF